MGLNTNIDDDDGAETEEEEDGHGDSHTPWSESQYNPDRNPNGLNFDSDGEPLISDSDDEQAMLDEEDDDTSEGENDALASEDESDAYTSSSVSAPTSTITTSRMNMQVRYAFSVSEGYRNGIDAHVMDTYGLRMDGMDYHRMELQSMLYPHNVVSDPPTLSQIRLKAHLEHREDRARLSRITSERLLRLPSTVPSMRAEITAEKLAADEVRRRCRDEYRRCAGILTPPSTPSNSIPPDIDHSAEDYDMDDVQMESREKFSHSTDTETSPTFMIVEPINGTSFADEDSSESNTADTNTEEVDSVSRLRGGAESDDDTDHCIIHRFHFVPRHNSAPLIIPPRSAVVIDVIMAQRTRQQSRTQARISQLRMSTSQPVIPQPSIPHVERALHVHSP